MFRKNYFTFLSLAFLLLTTGSLAASAQTQPISGTVVLQKADGTTEPVAGATVDAYRTDIKAKSSPAKTNKKGEFNFVGLQIGGTYVLSVSGANISPTYLPGVPSGQANVIVKVSAGDGKRLSEEEVRSALSTPAAAKSDVKPDAKPTAQSSEEEKKAIEARAKLEAEYAVKKKEVDNQNATVQKTLAEGNEAFNAKNYDLAVAKYGEGISASPDFVGSTPVLLNNKASALKNRAIGFHNESVKATDATAKLENINKSKKDFAEALASYDSSWKILKNAPAADIKDQTSYQANKTATLNGFKDLLRLMVQTEKADSEKLGMVETLFTEYAAAENDAAKKAETQVYVADIYRLGGSAEKAIAEYKKVLATSPDNPDALAGLGLSLANAGYNTDGTINMTMMQEAITNLQRFADVAPSNHKLKASVAETVAYLKTMNVKAEKPTKKKN